MISNSVVLNDFAQVKDLTLLELKSLIDELDEISDKISLELPLMLDSFAEIAGDKSGKTSHAQQMLKDYVAQFCDSIEASYAYKFFLAGLNYALNTTNAHRNIPSSPVEAPNSSGMPILGTDWLSLKPFAHSISLPWQSYDIPSYFIDESRRKTYFYSRNEKAGDPIKTFLSETITVNGNDLRASCGDITLVSKGLGSIEIDYFHDSVVQGILSDILMNETARDALRVFIAKSISEKILDIIGLKKQDDLDVITTDDNLAYDFYSHDLAEILHIYPTKALEEYCQWSYKKIKSLTPENDFPEWRRLKNNMEKFFHSLLSLSKNKDKQVALFLGDDRDILLSKIFDFLVENDLNPLSIPTISELGKYKGGFSIVKSISSAGGLKKIRQIYIPWAASATMRLKAFKSSRGDQQDMFKYISN